MHRKDKFYADAERFKPSKGARHDDMETLKNTFAANLPALPGELIDDMFGYFYAAYEDKLLARPALEEKLAALVSLFAMDYSEDDGLLTLEEWKTVADVVNDFAQDLDDTLLMYIMSRAVEKGCFKE